MDILSAIYGKLKLSIKVKPVAMGIIDDVLEPAIDKIVADTKNPFDDMLKKAVYPMLEAEIKDGISKAIDGLKLKIPEGLRDFIELE